jgi:predicted AlkP superfamily phosphohydrolase/phosphomutase
MVLHNKAVIIGLDGATWTLLRPWIDQGQLPHLARLVHEGASGPLTTTIPPVSASAWVSFATGCNPGKHGAFDFVFPQPGGYDIGVINVQVRGVPPFWKTIEEAGGQVGLMSVPITYPPQPIRGFTVNGFLVPNEQSAYTYPPELKEELKREGQRWPLHEFEGNRSRHPGRFLQDMLDFDVTRTNTILWMMRHKPWDLLACVLKTPDTVHHEVWHIIDPAHPRYDAELNRQFAPAVLDYFKQIDDCVGRIIAAAPPDAFVAIMSDHGGGPFHKFFHVNNWLTQQGLLKFKRTPLSLFKHALFKLGFTPITSLKIVNFFKLGRLRRRVKRGRGRGLLKRLFLSFGDVDWARTRAFAVGNFGQIYINVKGQRAQGTVEPGAEYEAVRAQIIQSALALRDPDGGDQVIAQVYKKEELYHGDRVALAPDLILHTDRSKYVSFGHADFGSNRILEPSIGQTGHHTMDGIVVLHGPGVKANEAIRGDIIDIAPTVLYVLGLPVPSIMDGKVLQAAFTSDYLTAHPMMRTTSPAEEAAAAVKAYSEEDEEQVMERLRQLGYVS